MKVSEFVKNFGPAAKSAAANSGIFPETIMAAAALESAWGRSKLTVEAYNFFGIKAGGSWKGATVSMSTREQRKDGTVYTVVAAFRKYNSPTESFRDYVALLNTPRYVNAGVTRASSPVEQVKRIKAAGYATDVDYPAKLIKIMTMQRGFGGGASTGQKIGGAAIGLLIIIAAVALKK